MLRFAPHARIALLVVTPLLGCPANQGSSGKDRAASADGEAAPAAEPPSPAPGADPEDNGEADQALGRVLPAAPLPIEDMLGADPPSVEPHLGEPMGKGATRKTCVRFVPERTWFRCQHAEQRYADPSGKFSAIGVHYEDGVATSLFWEGIPGQDPFDPEEALRAVGLELPGKPTVEHPEENVTVWHYFNDEARLRIHDREYRVVVSVVDDQWKRSKVELILNDALDADEKSRVIDDGQMQEQPG